ncbi:MAG: ABC transporter ATP-binding protein [Acidimicrobiales bacterium]
MSRDLGDAREGAVAVLRRGWRHSPELRHGAGLTLVLAAVGSAGRIAVPVLVQQAIDRGLSPGSVSSAAVAALGAVAAVVIVVTTLARRAAVIRLAGRSEAALYGLRMRAFAHVHALGVADHAEERRGVLVARVTSDVETLSRFFGWDAVAWLLDGLTMAAVAAVMLVYDWRLAIVVFVVSAPLWAVLRVLQRHLIVAHDRARAGNAEVLGQLSELVSGGAVIRTHRMEGPVRVRLSAAVGDHVRAGRRASFLGALLFPVGEVFAVLAVGAVLVLGVGLGPAGGLTTGTLVGFVLLTYRFLEPIAEFTELLDQTQAAVAGWRRVLALLDVPIEIADPPDGRTVPPGPPALELRDVSFTYRPRGASGGATGGAAEEPPTLTTIDVTIEPATSVAVVGATGSGKTTLARLLTRLVDPTQGAVLVGGVDAREARLASLRSTVVLVPQEPFLFDSTVGDNVRLGRPGLTEAELRSAFAALGLEDWLAGLPAGSATAVGERGEQLSAGERQLVALVRAFVADPPCLVLDEATSSVDAATEARLACALDGLAQGRTTVTIAHRLSTAARADRVLVLDRGRLVEQGTHAELVAAGGVYAGLWASWLDATAAGAAQRDT